ncbi:MAG: hypothetical protein AB8B85_03110 [Paracoccaceae bacterium]
MTTWKEDDNHNRPHPSPGNLTPNAVEAKMTSQKQAACGQKSKRRFSR